MTRNETVYGILSYTVGRPPCFPMELREGLTKAEAETHHGAVLTHP